ncbi:MAG: DUF6701 domain-containing protein [Burkholderiales bacterium]
MPEPVVKSGKWGMSRGFLAVFMLLFAVNTAQAAVGFRAAAFARQTSNVSGGTITVNKPAGTVSGDVMLASVAVVTNTSTVATPAGWTLVQSMNQTGTNPSRLYTFYKVAGGSEPATYAWTFTGSNVGAVAAISSYTGVDTTAPIDASAGQLTPSSTTHTALSVTTTVAGDMLVTVHEYASSRNWTPPGGMTEAVDSFSRGSGGTSGVSMEMNYESRPATGATGTRTATASASADRGATQAIALKALVVVTNPGDFNVYDTSTAPASALDGVIQTKVAAQAFSLDIAALNVAKNALLTTYTQTVKVELLDASSGGVLDANNCNAGWGVMPTVIPNQTFTGSTAGAGNDLTVTGSAGRHRVSNIVENNTWRNVAVRVSYPATGAATSIGCSTDHFAIRPASFTGLTVRDADWQTAGTARVLNTIDINTGGYVHKAGRPFRIDAFVQNAAGTGIAYSNTAGSYFGLPQATPITCLLPSACTLGTLNELGAATAWTAGASTGSFFTTTATYDDAGSFTMQLVDSTFAAVDASDGTPANCTGQYVCSSTTPSVGRFVPDSFELVDASATDPLVDLAVDTWLPLAAAQFRTFGLADASCNAAAPAPLRAFTYIGQPFGYVSVPQVTFKAMDANGSPMGNYSSPLMRLTTSGIAQTYTAASGTLTGTPGTPTLPLNGKYTDGSGSPIVLTIVASATDTLTFTRSTTTPAAPFNANISLTITAQDSSENGTIGNGVITGTVTLSSIGFDSGNEMRFGRLFVPNTYGTEKLNLTIPIEAQYWTGSIWARNTFDNCTSVNLANSAQLANKTGALSGSTFGPPAVYFGTPATTTATMAQGLLTLTLAKPNPIAIGYVDLGLNLGSAAGSAQVSCPPAWVAPSPASVSGLNPSLAHLRGQWCSANYDRDPSARLTLGVSRNKFIFNRENY